MKCTSEDEVIVCTDFLKAILEVSVKDETSGLVDNDESKDGPV